MTEPGGGDGVRDISMGGDNCANIGMEVVRAGNATDSEL